MASKLKIRGLGNAFPDPEFVHFILQQPRGVSEIEGCQIEAKYFGRAGPVLCSRDILLLLISCDTSPTHGTSCVGAQGLAEVLLRALG